MWPAGMAAVIVTIMLDTSLVELGAFKFSDDLFYQYRGVPLLYIFANFASGMILARLVPADGILKPIITVGLAAVFLLMEWIAIMLGYFEHLNWSLLRGLGLNIIGFIAVLWVADLFDIRRRSDNWLNSPILKRIRN
jgi:hypothetical protein